MAYDCPWLSEFLFNYSPSLNTQKHKSFVHLNSLSFTQNPSICILSLSFTGNKHSCLTHSHNEFQPHASQLKRVPRRTVGIWAVFLFQGLRMLYEEWMLYGEKWAKSALHWWISPSILFPSIIELFIWAATSLRKFQNSFTSSPFYASDHCIHPFAALTSSKLNSESFGFGKIF